MTRKNEIQSYRMMSDDAATGTTQLEQMSWMFFSTMRRMTRLLDIHSRELEKRYGLTVPQLNVLWALGTTGRTPVGQIAGRAGLSSATVTSIVDRLEEHGLVSRQRSTDDKRQVLLSLTAAGHAVLSERPQPFHECFIERLGHLERWERTQLLSAVQRIASMMEPEGNLPPEAAVDAVARGGESD